MSEMNKSEIQRKHFNKISKKYNSARLNKSHLAYKETWWNYLFKKLSLYTSISENSKGLEAMCGTAELSRLVINKFQKMKFDAFDYSDAMVEEAKLAVKGYDIDIFQADAISFKRDQEYDLVILIGGLHHVPDNLKLVLDNIYSSLKPGGVFVCLEPTQNNILFKKIREYIYKKNSLFEESSERGFDLSELNDSISASKLQVIDQYYPGLIGYILFYNPDAFPFLNFGGIFIAKLFARIDLILSKTFVGKYFSFATWTIAKRV
jgi:ubiquinone/menaquinone biosynthesis C-methylase UbiE